MLKQVRPYIMRTRGWTHEAIASQASAVPWQFGSKKSVYTFLAAAEWIHMGEPVEAAGL